MSKTIHHGRNIKRFREMLGFKQESLATELGEDWNQRKISLLEQKDIVDIEIIDRIASILKVSPDAIKSFDEEAPINIIGNTVTNHDQSSMFNYYPTFNPIDKIVELYDALLKSEQEKLELMKKILEKMP